MPERDGAYGPQWLNVHVRQIRPRTHDALRNKVVEAIHQEIVPRVDAPLDSAQVLARHEGSQPIRSPDAHSLAALNAYLGNAGHVHCIGAIDFQNWSNGWVLAGRTSM